jgi:transcriptional regulator with GAF, ATPase, and Fis domain/tetratricopeptide (TPR) repeat protein
MKNTMPDFSDEQWRFLAVLAAFDTGVPIHIAGHLAPLLPGPLFDVISRSKAMGWIVQSGEDHFAATQIFVKASQNKLTEINTPEYNEILISRLNELHLEPDIKSKMMGQLMNTGGFEKKAGLFDITIAEKALKAGDHEKAWIHFQRAATRLMKLTDDKECSAWIISTVQKLSNLSFILGRELTSLPEYLHTAHEIAAGIGDKRSHALINLHLGRLYYFSDRRSDALVALSVGLNEIEELADEDILDQSAGFLGLYYCMQGLFREALVQLERAERVSEADVKNRLVNPMVPVLMGYSFAYLGEFHRAIGYLDSHWRIAKAQSNNTMAMSLRVILGTVLILINREKEAALHIDAAIKEAKERKNAFALFLARGALALQFIKSGQVTKAHELMKQSFEEAAASGFVRQFSSPWILEMLFEFEKMGLQPISGLSFHQAMDRAIKENNIHLHGVALRLLAQKKIAGGFSVKEVKNDLIKSREYLDRSGDIMQLSKTIIETARLELAAGNQEQARHDAQTAWKVLGGYATDFFPDELSYLLESEDYVKHSQESVERFIEMTESMFPVYNQDEILTRAVIATNRFFDAERGGLFWFPGGKMSEKPELRASCNLSISDIAEPGFVNFKKLILKAFTENRPIIMRNIESHPNSIGRTVKAVLCLPVEVRNKVRAVIYHDNSYLEDCFDSFNPEIIKKVGNHVSRQVARIYEYFRLREERNDLISEKSLQDAVMDEKPLIYQCSRMVNIISQLDKAAVSDSTVLILGDTGVGKELIARRIHSMSKRSVKPFIIVDANTIPEGLIESELFGHEKGAFTGADRQKKGRLELADQGTLLIDEIGELPKSIQVKLLRAIQERSFFRVGGTRTLHSDFRLIAATNRDLIEEVKVGRFREDLYYRLNVVPFRIPSLAERAEDIPLLANHFLSKYSQKYHRTDLILDPKTETLLKTYHWPGNIRELENVIERSVLLSPGNLLEIDLAIIGKNQNHDVFSDHPTIDDLQKRYISYILDKTKGRISGPKGAAKILGLKRTTLTARMNKLGMI